VVLEGCLYYIDIAFPHLKLAIEIDGRLHEEDEDLFESDRWRQNALVALSYSLCCPDHSASCERRESRADDRRNDERTRFLFARSDDDVGFPARCASSRLRKLRQPRGTTKLANSARPFPSSAHGPGTFTTASALVGNLLSI
jgi:hypothetical protein